MRKEWELLERFLRENCPKGVFVTGTGTEVGKTFVSGLILKKLRESGLDAGYYKAALSGAEELQGKLLPGDADYVYKVAGLQGEAAEAVSYCYRTAVSPHLAAKREGNPPELAQIKQDFRRVSDCYEFVLAEGSGGIICPLRFDEKVIMLCDVIQMLALPLLLVSEAGLGSINAAVLTVEYSRARGVPIRGIILNRFEEGNFLHEDNLKMIEALTNLPVLFTISEAESNELF